MTWSSIDLDKLLSANGTDGLLLDPYLIWGLLTAFRGYAPSRLTADGQPYLDVLVGLPLNMPDAALPDLRTRLGATQAYKNFPATPPWRHFTGCCTVRDWLKCLQDYPVGLRIELAAAVDYSRPLVTEGRDVPKSDKATLAVVDDGCPVFRGNLLNPDGMSRVVGLWDQGVLPQHSPMDPNWVATSFNRGRQWKGRETGSDMSARDDADRYEDMRYLETKYQTRVDRSLPPPTALHSHGAHVLDLLAGNIDPLTESSDAASDAHIVFVNLPDMTVRDSSGGSLGARVLDALHYIRLSTQTGKTPQPTIVNLSYGTQAGPHDGTSLSEKAIDEMLLRCQDNFAIVVGAGNSRRAQSHAVAQLAGNGASWEAEFELPDDDDTDGFVELWYESVGGTHPSISLTTPDGDAAWTSWGIGAPGVQALTDADGKAVAAIIQRAQVPNGAKSMALIALSGRGTAMPPRPSAPAGRWRIKIQAPTPLTVNLWIERDDLAGRRGRPMRFVAPEGIWRDDDTLGSLSGGQHTIVVGALRRSDGRALPYSSIGPKETDALPERPHVFGPGAENDAMPGLLASGVRTGSGYVMGGTSVAAPVVARQLFNEMMVKVKGGGKVGRQDWGELLTKVVMSCQTSHGIRMPAAKDFDSSDDLD